MFNFIKRKMKESKMRELERCLWIEDVYKKISSECIFITNDSIELDYEKWDYTPNILTIVNKYADKKEAKYVLIMGEDEVSNKTAKLKNMQTSEEMEVALNPEEIYQKIQ